MHQHNRKHLLDRAARVLGNRESVSQWLVRPSLQLGGRSPRGLIGMREGAQRLEELLAQIDDHRRLHGM